MRASEKIAIALLLLLVAGCTPEYVKQQTAATAQQARLLDAVDIKRSNPVLLSRQAQVCLLSASGGTEAGAELLRTMQAGLSGYFLAVGVDGDSIDYLRAVATDPCPGASYLFYVQPVDPPSCPKAASDGGEKDAAKDCDIGSQFLITVISAGSHTLVDRVQFSIKSSFIPTFTAERERQQKAFAQLAIALTGAK